MKNHNSDQNRRLSNIENSVKVINGEIGDVRIEMTKIKNDTKWMKDEFGKMKATLEEVNSKVGNRPTWLIATSFSVLFSALVGLIVYLVTH